MTLDLVLGGLATLVILGYLVVALIHPEHF